MQPFLVGKIIAPVDVPIVKKSDITGQEIKLVEDSIVRMIR